MRANEAILTRPFVSCWPFCNGASTCLLEYRRHRHRHNILSVAGIGIAALVIVFAVALRDARLNDEQFVPKGVVHNPSYEDGIKLVMEVYDGREIFWEFLGDVQSVATPAIFGAAVLSTTSEGTLVLYANG